MLGEVPNNDINDSDGPAGKKFSINLKQRQNFVWVSIIIAIVVIYSVPEKKFCKFQTKT